MIDKVVNLRSRQKLNDIPGMLRQLAEDFEAGKQTASRLIVLIPPTEADPGHWPVMYGYGDSFDKHYCIALLELAKVWFIHELIESN